MSKRVCQDSLARCDLYSNQYDPRMQSHPSLIKARQDSYRKTQDTMGSAGAALEKEILLKLLQGNLTASKGLLLPVAKGIKFVFLAIMLPPYIFCYGIPKWLAASGLPKMYQLTAHMIRRIFDKVGKVAEKYVTALKTWGQQVTSPILSFIHTRVEKARELYVKTQQAFFSLVAYPFRLIQQKLFQPVAHRYAKVKEALDKWAALYGTAKEGLTRLAGHAQNFFPFLVTTLKDKGVELANRTVQGLAALLAVVQRSFTPFSSRAAAAGHLLQEVVARVKNAYQAVISRPLARAFAAAKDFSQKLQERLAEPLIAWANPVLEALKKAGRKGKEKIKAVSESVEKGIKQVTTYTAAIAASAAEIILTPALSLFTPLIQFFNPQDRKRRGKGGQGRRMLQKLKQLAAKGKKQAAVWMHQIQVFLRRKGGKYLQLLKKLPAKLWALIKAGAIFLFTALKGAFLIFRLMLAWLKALIRYGFLLLKEMTQSFFYE